MKKTFTIYFLLINLIMSSQSYVYDHLDINNIKARFQSAGLLFNDPYNNTPAFEVIPGSNQHTIYAGNLWLGGVDGNNQLHLAGEKYSLGGQWGDFYPGPVSNASVYATSHFDWNYVWKVTKDEIDEFIDWYNCGQTPGCIQNSSYTIPSVITNWPGNGAPWSGQNQYIAPFYDMDQNGIYNPNNGDHPCIKGDMAIFTVFNDDYNHLNSGGDSLRVEVRAMHYAYNSSDSALANTIFSEYTLINFSNETYTDMKIGLWLDMDIGCSEDDYTGCDVERNLAYTFNSDSVDNQGCNGASPFGNRPPAQGVVVLRGPKQDEDNLDNPIGIGLNESINGCGYGDGIIDNERIGMSGFISFDRTLNASIFGDPVTAVDYHNYLNNIWRDGSHLVYGGFGHISSSGATSIQANYMFPDSSDNIYFSGTNGVDPGFDWSEYDNSGSGTFNPYGDRRILTSMGSFTMEPLSVQEFTIAHIAARNYVDNTPPSSVALLKSYTDDIINFYACDSLRVCTSQLLSVNEDITNDEVYVEIYPNPTEGIININTQYKVKTCAFYSITGECLMIKETSDVNSINLAEFPKGFYLLKVILENGNSSTVRVVKK